MSFFVEVGSCDFDTCEQLIKNGWKGLVIEPVKVYFDKLPKYDSIIYENIAIDSTNGQSVIHYINPKYITENNKWEKGISSSLSSGGPLSLPNNQHIKRYQNPTKQEVYTYTLNQICEKHNIKNIDFLKIDTEGHEFEVLKGMGQSIKNIKYILVEFHNDEIYLSYNPRKIHSHLIKNNFVLKATYKFPFTTWEDRFYFNNKFK